MHALSCKDITLQESDHQTAVSDDKTIYSEKTETTCFNSGYSLIYMFYFKNIKTKKEQDMISCIGENSVD